jgi:hypothetical protein
MIGTKGTNRIGRFGWALLRSSLRKLLLCGCVWLSAWSPASAAPNFNLQDPLAFFTAMADAMLRASTAQWRAQDFRVYTNTFGARTTTSFSITNIPVYVDGVFTYTPAVNRLLQLAANVYDATTNSPYPSVFRPLFSLSGSNVYITGFTNLNSPAGMGTVSGLNDLQLSTPLDVSTVSTLGVSNLAANVNIYGVPWIIGAKKGLPNFNEFSMENTLSVTRRLQLTRTTNTVTPLITGTNQMYLMGLTSSIGVELWNSYASNYPGSILVGVNENISITITNDDHAPNLLFLKNFSTNVLMAINNWPGSGMAPWNNGNPFSGSFVIANFAGPTLSNAVYRSYYANGNPTYTLGLFAPGFIDANYFNSPSPLLFETNSLNGFYLPQFGVTLTNRLQVFLLDYDTNGAYRVIDYVHFAGPNSSFNINSNLADADVPNNPAGVWNTNYPSGNVALFGPTFGILNQINISKGGATVSAEDGLWSADPEAFPPSGTMLQQQAIFQAFFKPGNRTTTPIPATNLLLSTIAPYSPKRYIVHYLTWQANDPLVHYLASDIDYPLSPNNTTVPRPGVSHYNSGQTISGLSGLNLGRVNDHYMPWSGNSRLTTEQLVTIDTNRYNLAQRDPLVTQSDNWNFPTSAYSNFNWLGRIHRGTPWQSVYLKSRDILANNNIAAWQAWTGDQNMFDASNCAPVQDWHLAALLTSMLNPNPVEQLVSVNNSDTNVWLNLFGGMIAGATSQPDIFDVPMIIRNSRQAENIVNAIQTTRANRPGQSFGNVGDILATAALSDQSPFLDWGDIAQIQSGISDEAYEIIPGQLLSLLRMDSTGAVALNNGQVVANFTGWDGHAYVIQVSSNLIDWISVSTNCPVNGNFFYTNPPAVGPQFYRTRLLP